MPLPPSAQQPQPHASICGTRSSSGPWAQVRSRGDTPWWGEQGGAVPPCPRGDACHTGAGHPRGPGTCLGKGGWRSRGRLTTSTLHQGAEAINRPTVKMKPLEANDLQVNSLQPPPEARFGGDILLNEHPRVLWAARQPSPGTGGRGAAPWRPQGERGTGGFRYRVKGPLHYKNRCKVLTHGVRGETGKPWSDSETGLPIHPTLGVCLSPQGRPVRPPRRPERRGGAGQDRWARWGPGTCKSSIPGEQGKVCWGEGRRRRARVRPQNNR